MIKLFVPYDISLKLQEMGFDENCMAYYKHGSYKNNNGEFGYLQIPVCNSDNDDSTKFITAPLYQQVIDWFEDKHRIYIETSMYVVDKGEYDGCYAFKSIIKDTENYKEKMIFEKDGFPNRYKALNESIEHALKLI